MLLEAKYRIGLIFEEIEKKSTTDKVTLKRIKELKEKVDLSMQQNDDLQKWNRYQSTGDYHKIIGDFKDSFWNDYPQISIARFYFESPAFFNED